MEPADPNHINPTPNSNTSSPPPTPVTQAQDYPPRTSTTTLQNSTTQTPTQPIIQPHPQTQSETLTPIPQPNQEVKVKPSIKIQIVGFLLIISSAIMIFSFLISMLMFFGDGAMNTFIPGIMALLFGIFGLKVGSGIRSLKKWAWYAGTIILGLALLGNVISLVVNFEVFLTLPIFLEVFSIYALISEKGAFLSHTS
jgi:hypothetical protein